MPHFKYRLSRISAKKFWYYFSNASSHFLARATKHGRAEAFLKRKGHLCSRQDVLDRLNYYNSISETFGPSGNAVEYSNFLLESSTSTIQRKDRNIGSTYFYDLVDLMDYFGPGYNFDYDCGDVTTEPTAPAFVKSRPIKDSSHNGILLKLDAIRHFSFARDNIDFADKKSMAVFRGPCHQEHRQAFVERCHDLPNVDIGDIRKSVQGKAFYKAPMTIAEQLQYKYIVSVEGNDVATNLKWIMSSNSLCFMRRPRYETWFMEGRLIPDVHYVLLKDDFSDLQEKMEHYQKFPGDALRIIRNANQWVAQFLNRDQERLLGLMVIAKYFRLSGQQAFW
ncbi:glycosyl transferase family 90 [Ralstonia insidiosa]|uniref:Lipopolysaccharide-modifying protein n=1 Tax=Ralstonia insidiosa TaxID=190721 RepID=A0A848P0F0_9RALS|nr:glycosyl transferase family 90 [Ralstonia insidiosa]NMV40792.1 lipopolysaccharide-modifying protein [Ralstonia insidiosa]